MSFTLTNADGTPHPFTAYYQQIIKPLTQPAETERIAALKSTRRRLLVAIPLTPMLAVGSLLLWLTIAAHQTDRSHSIGELFAFPFFIFIGAVFTVLSPLKKYQLEVQKDIYPLIFRFFGADFTFVSEGRNLVQQWQGLNMLPNYDDAYEQDYLSGSHNGVPLELQEVRLTEDYHDQKGNLQTRQVFRGLLLRLQFNKPFEGKTLLLKDNIVTNLLHGSNEYGLQRVKLEDPQFEAVFQVFASSQIESRRLLTPAFMQRLLNLAAISGARPQACFAANSLYITLESDRDRFAAPSPFLPATFQSEIRDILDEMHEIFRMVDELKLNEKTGV